MRTLVTGGAGFVGSALARALLAAGDDVVVLDDLSTGVRGHVPAGARLVAGDVRDPHAVREALAGAQRVFHLAAAVGPGLVAAEPEATWSRNAGGARRVLAACAERRVPVLFASSSEVYRKDGASPSRGLREEDPLGFDPADRRAVYARSKLAGEALCGAHARRGLPVVIARLFNVVGAGQLPRHGMVLARFAAAACAGSPLPIHGDGRQQRCFLHVEDAVEALLALQRMPAARGRAVNVGSERSVSVRSLARRVAAAAGHPGTTRTVAVEALYGRRFSDPRVRRPDVGLLRSLTAWRPRRSLDDAIEDALAFARRLAAQNERRASHGV